MSNPRFDRARNGSLTVSLDGRHLHSRFDPVREAERFVAGVARERPHLVIVLGPGLGYAFDAVRRLAPGTRTVALPLLEGVLTRTIAQADATWRPGRESIDAFLTRELTDLDTASLAVLEWQPVVDAAGATAERVRKALSEHLNQAQASLVTRGATGRRWYRNRLHNYLHIAPLAPARASRRVAAVVVAGAGPSLERGIPAIAGARERIELWATSSSLAALVHAGLVPDLVVATDTALYAWEHLRPLASGGTSTVPVAAPLAATRGLAWCPRVAPLSEGDPEDDALLGSPGTGVPTVPPQGTVTATAAGLARQLTSAPLVVAGADFAWLDARSHARPHLSHAYRACGASRLAPQATSVYDGARTHLDIGDGWTTDRTLSTYAAWFAGRACERYAPFAVLHPSPALAGAPSIDAEGLGRLEPRHPGVDWHPIGWPREEERRLRIRRHTRGLREIVEEAETPPHRARLSVERPRLSHLAVSLALPELLRWYRLASDDPRAQNDAWQEVRAAVLNELASLEETFG